MHPAVPLVAPAATLAAALHQAQQQGIARIDAQMLMLMALGRDALDRAWLIAHSTDPLPLACAQRFAAYVEQRRLGMPTAYIRGQQEFFGLMLHVDPRVLVPRPETETLVQWALDLLASPAYHAAPARVLDLGTGSGAIALAIKAQQPRTQVHASDASAAALTLAKANANQLQLWVDFHCGHWLDAVPAQRFDLIVSNPPYIAQDDPHLAALHHEPSSALHSGPDGLDDLTHIINHAHTALAPAGWLLLEHGYHQASAVRALLAHAQFNQISTRCDLAGIERCTTGQYTGIA